MARFLYIPQIGDKPFYVHTFLHFSRHGASWKLRDYSRGVERNVLDNKTSPYSVNDIRSFAVHDLQPPHHPLTDVSFWHNETKDRNQEYSIGSGVQSPVIPRVPQPQQGDFWIFGYSERGLVNALFYEILQAQHPHSLLSNLLTYAHFPFMQTIDVNIVQVELLIEQSFSDFGDADMVLLIKTEEEAISIFMEAKVKSAQVASWSIREEFNRFVNGTKARLNSSNLFTQLYHKCRMVNSLRTSGITAIKQGLPFPACSTKPTRKIGDNPVVLRAVGKVRDYLQTAYYLAIVPDREESVEGFFTQEFKQTAITVLPEWDVKPFGYLTWSEIRRFCEENKLGSTLRNFVFNKSQIY